MTCINLAPLGPRFILPLSGDTYRTRRTEAAFACLPNLTALLIDNGADVNAVASSQTPLARLRNIKDMNPGPCSATEQILLAHGAK